jgi:predicted N-acetyltransferase YhbS
VARPSIVAARPADLTAIGQFLAAVFPRPEREAFRTSQDDPFHEPHDRLLLKSGPRIVGHVHLTRRVMQFGSLELPVAGLHALGLQPDFRGQGYGRRLLAAAEKQMAADGALLGLLWTRAPQFFARHGWARCCRDCRSGATARDVLAGLETLGLHRRSRRLNIRLWRRMELGALVRTYAQNLPASFGSFHRSEAYWRWLVNRKAFDQIYVALDGPDLLELEENRSPIVGYAVTRGDCILELFTAPGRIRAAAELVARACADAIERDHHTVVLHAPPGSRLDKLFRRAGGRRADCAACTNSVLMVKLLDPVRLFDALGGPLHRRAESARLALPAQLGFLVEGRKYQLQLDPDGVQARSGHLGRSYLRLDRADFTRLLLGQLDLRRALSEGRVCASTALAANTARALLPRHPFWRPPLDELSV